MSWICYFCGTENDDSNTECEVCVDPKHTRKESDNTWRAEGKRLKAEKKDAVRKEALAKKTAETEAKLALAEKEKRDKAEAKRLRKLRKTANKRGKKHIVIPLILAVVVIGGVLLYSAGLLPDVSYLLGLFDNGDNQKQIVIPTVANNGLYVITEDNTTLTSPVGTYENQLYGKTYDMYYNKTLNFPYSQTEDIRYITLKNVDRALTVDVTISPKMVSGRASDWAQFTLTDQTSQKPNIAYGRVHSSSELKQKYTIYGSGDHKLKLSGNDVDVWIRIYG